MSNRQLDKLRAWIAIAGVVLGIFAVGLSLYTNKQSADRTAAALSSFTAASCVRQHASADQWDSVIAVIRDLNEKAKPGSSTTPSFQTFVKLTHNIYSTFPACKGLHYDPVTKKAT